MKDTKALLTEGNRGCKYATETIEIALGYAKGASMRSLLSKYGKEHENVKARFRKRLNTEGIKEGHHPAMGAAMAKLHMNVSLTMNPTDSRIAELMINGCNMGIKTLSRLKNRHPSAAPESVCLVGELIDVERGMAEELLKFLR